MPYRNGKVVDWKYKIDLNSILHENLSFEETRDKFVLAIKKTNLFNEIEDVLLELEIAETIEEFDNWLTDLYDYADDNLIWLGI